MGGGNTVTGILFFKVTFSSAFDFPALKCNSCVNSQLCWAFHRNPCFSYFIGVFLLYLYGAIVNWDQFAINLPG